MNTQRMLLVRKLLGLALFVVCLGYFISFFLANLSGLQDLSLVSDHLLPLLLATIAIIICNTILPAYSWWLLINPVQPILRRTHSIWIYAYTQIGKYLPGNIGHHVGRIFVSSQFGIDRKVATWSVVSEAVLMLIFAMLQIMLISIFFQPSLELPVGDWLLSKRLWLSLLLVSLLIFGVYFIVNRLRWYPIRNLIGEWTIPLPTLKTVLTCCVISMASALLMGCALAYIGYELFSISFSNYWTILFAWIFAWTIGFLFPGAPAGLGVREGIIAALLEASLGGAATLGLIVVHRLVTSLVDILVFAVAFQQRRRFLPQHSTV